MKIVGLTGGIGSGKTTVATFFKELGIPVYIADIEAKKLTNSSKVIIRKVTQLFGKDSYIKGKLNRPYIANIVFKDKQKLEQLNAIIHPRVARHFVKWMAKQDAPYCIKEAAILFENGSFKSCDEVILVIAPKNSRISRVLKRDKSTRQAIEDRMQHQWSDTKKRALTRLIIENSDLDNTKIQVLKLHEKLLIGFQKS